MIYLLIIPILLLTGCSTNTQNLGADTLDDTVNTLEQEQVVYKTNNGKYKFEKKKKVGNYEVEQHEFIRPDGTRGYRIYLEKTENDKMYLKTITKFDGENAVDTGWILIQDLTSSTPTST